MRSIGTMAIRGAQQLLSDAEFIWECSALGYESKFQREVPEIRVYLYYGKKRIYTLPTLKGLTEQVENIFFDRNAAIHIHFVPKY